MTVGQSGSSNLTLVNNGSAEVEISRLGTSENTFSIAGQNNLPITIAPNGGTYTVTLQFAPQGTGDMTGQLTVDTTSPNISGTSSSSSNISTSGDFKINLHGKGQPASKSGSAALSSLTCSLASMAGAGTDACTVTLSVAAGTGGLAVSLSSNDAAVTVPASVTVPAGATSAGFTATVSAVSTAQTAKLTATAGGVSQTYTISLGAYVPALTLSSTSLNYGNVTVNTTSTQRVNLTSSGTAPLTISADTVTGAGFSVSGISTPLTLNPGQTATVAISLDPTTTGTETGTLTLTDNATPSTATINLSGTGQAVQAVAITISPTQAALQVGSQQQFAATVSNTTNTNVTWQVNGIVNGNATYGTISSSGMYTAPASVPSGGTVTVSAVSAADTTKSASASVTLAAATQPVAITISPTSASVQGNQTQQFTAQISGTTNTGVNWLVHGALGGDSTYGTISPSGLYTAPACPSVSSVTVTAQSAYDSTVSANATVSLGSASLNATDRYVDTTGSDSNDGSACHPWATIEYAASLAQPGWTVHVGPGTYNVGSGIVNNNSGNSSARIVYIGNYDKSTRTWNTKLVSTGTAVWTTDANYVDIVGFDLTSTNTSATWGFHTGGSYIRIKDNYVHDIYSDSPGAGIMIGGGGTTTGVEVNGNVVAREAHTPGGNTDNQCIYTTESHTTIVNNIVFGCNKYGIQIYSSLAGGSNYNVMANNTVFASYNGIVVGGETGSGTPTVDYNTITNNIVYGVTNYGFNASGIFGSHNVTSNNLTYNNGTNYSSSYTNHTNDIVADPLFVNYQSDGTGNYQLQPASPCINAGTSSGAPAYDFLHTTRPQGSAVDCGAYEFVP